MTDVSGRTVAALRDLLVQADLDVAAAFRRAPFSPAAPPARLPWEDLCALLEEVERVAGGPAALERLGEGIPHTTAFAAHAGVLRLVLAPDSLYRMVQEWLTPTLLPVQCERIRELEGGRLELGLTVQPGRPSPPALWWLLAGGLRALPRLLGLADAYVELRITGRRITFVVLPPPTAALRSRVRRAWAALRSPERELEEGYAASFEQLVRDQQELRDRLREVEAARAAAEEAATLEASFLSTLSHEVRTPMNGVIGMAELLLDGELDAEQRAHARTMRDAAGAVMETLNGVLDLAKLEAGRAELERGSFDPCELVESVQEALAQAAKERQVELRCVRRPAVPGRLEGDAGRLRQVLLNLVGHVVRSSEAGPVVVEVGLANEEPGAAAGPEEVTVALAVRGAGSRASAGAGRGDLGFSVCRRLCELMGIALAAERGPGEGTSYRLTLRARRAPSTPPAQGPDGAAADPPPAHGPGSRRLLVVDDDAVNRRLLTALLERLGHVVHAVDGGEAAVRAAQRVQYDAVFMDCLMPGLDGFGAAARIRSDELSREDGAHRVPIVAVTASLREETRDACQAAGMDAYLPKPIDRARLGEVLRSVLGRA